MRYVFILLLVYSCRQSPTPISVTVDEPVKQKVDSTSIRIQQLTDRFHYLLDVRRKRDSFIFKKLENEVLYYKTQNDKYRRIANRCIDSAKKYVRIIDSVSKEIK